MKHETINKIHFNDALLDSVMNLSCNIVEIDSSKISESESDVGLRQSNEDFIIRFGNSSILCDGMGGAESGEISSRLIAYSFYKICEGIDFERLELVSDYNSISLYLKDLFSRTQDLYIRLLQRFYPRLLDQSSGTTLSACLNLTGNKYLCFSVGDSNIYKCFLNGYNEKISGTCYDESIFKLFYSELFNDLKIFIESDPSFESLSQKLLECYDNYAGCNEVLDYLKQNILFMTGDFELRTKIMNAFVFYWQAKLSESHGYNLSDCFTSKGLRLKNLSFDIVELNSDEFLIMSSDGFTDNVSLENLNFSSIPSAKSLVLLAKKIMSKDIKPYFNSENTFVRYSKKDNVSVVVTKHDSLVPTFDSTTFDEFFMERLDAEDLKLVSEEIIYCNSISVEERPSLKLQSKTPIIKISSAFTGFINFNTTYLSALNHVFSLDQANELLSLIHNNATSIVHSVSGRNVVVSFDFSLNVGSHVYMLNEVNSQVRILKAEVKDYINGFYCLESYFERTHLSFSLSTLDLIHRSAVMNFMILSDYNFLNFILEKDEDSFNYQVFQDFVHHKSINLVALYPDLIKICDFDKLNLFKGAIVSYLDDFCNFKVTVLEDVIDSNYLFQNGDFYSIKDLALRGLHLYKYSNVPLKHMPLDSILNVKCFLEKLELFNFNFQKHFNQSLSSPMFTIGPVDTLLNFQLKDKAYLDVVYLRISLLPVSEILRLWKAQTTDFYSEIFEKVLVNRSK